VGDFLDFICKLVVKFAIDAPGIGAPRPFVQAEDTSAIQ
jgi:hypothetical protein